MIRHAFNVADTFNIRGRGVVVATDKRRKDLPSWLALKVGDEIELHSEGHIMRTRVAGNVLPSPLTPQTPFGFVLPADVPKDQVTIGCEIWVTESSLINPVEDK